MNQEDMNEFHKLICEYANKKGLDAKELLSAMAAIFIVTMSTNELTDTQADIILSEMKKDYAIHPGRKNKWN